jgi:hypothetical protein
MTRMVIMLKNGEGGQGIELVWPIGIIGKQGISKQSFLGSCKGVSSQEEVATVSLARRWQHVPLK